MKTIKIVMVPGATKEFVVDNNTTYKQALALFTTETGKQVDKHDVMVDDKKVKNLDAPITGCRIILTERVKGNK